MFRYVIVATNGRSWPVFASQAESDAANCEDDYERPVFILPDLLRDGWQPVRETPIGDKFTLALLRKGPEPINGMSQGRRT